AFALSRMNDQDLSVRRKARREYAISTRCAGPRHESSGPRRDDWRESKMIRSMTGFARRERQGPWGTLSCELRTVNHRYLEISLGLPEEVKALDNEIRQVIGATLRRGKVDANLYLKASGDVQRSLELDMQLLDELAARIAQIRERVKDSAPISPI